MPIPDLPANASLDQRYQHYLKYSDSPFIMSKEKFAEREQEKANKSTLSKVYDAFRDFIYSIIPSDSYIIVPVIEMQFILFKAYVCDKTEKIAGVLAESLFAISVFFSDPTSQPLSSVVNYK